MINYLKKPLIFIWKDFITETSYKLSFVLQIVWVFLSIATFYFLSKLFEGFTVSYLKPYGGNYFAFVLIGIAFFSYLSVSVQELSKSIREGQMLGTLEALIVTQTAIPTIILSSTLYGFIWASFRVIVYLLLGMFIFGVNLKQANLAGALLILVLTISSFVSLGIISASFIMVFKKGDPIGQVFTRISGILGGLYYPISVLPDWLQILSYFLPITYALEGMRLSLLQGYSLSELKPNVIALSLFSIIMLPLSLFIFSHAVKRAKRDGTLTQY